MGLATFKKEASEPSTPTSGYAKLYFENASLKYKDDTGTVYTVATGLTQEDVQDIVANLVVSSASVTWNYNDASNTLTATVAASGVNHNALQNYIANQHIDHSSVSVNAGTGLTGGGDLTSTRTISMPAVGTAGTYGSATQVPVITTDTQGRVSAVTNTSIAVTSAAVSDFVEAAQDAVGNILADSSSIDLIYNDAGNTISGSVIPSGVNHNALQNYSANEHIDHSAVSITTSGGLTGGGTIAANRDISIVDTGVVPGVYGSVGAVPILTVNSKGQITNAGTAVLGSSGWSAAIVTTPLNNTSNATLTNISELSVAVTANKTYRFEVYLLYRTAATTTGIAVTFGNTSAAGTIAGMVQAQIAADATNALFTGHITAFADVVVTTGVQAAAVDYICKIEGIFVCTTGGNIFPQFRSEVNGSQVTIQNGSHIIVREF